MTPYGRRDYETSTVDGAAGYERHQGGGYDYDDRPTRAELDREAAEDRYEDGPER